MDKEELKQLIRDILSETENDDSRVRHVSVPAVKITETDRLETGDSAHKVYTHDLFALSQSPRLGCGVMEMERTTFPWTLEYDEIDYVIYGHLTIYDRDRSVTAGPGELILIPKGSSILFSAQDKTRFLYVTYPADWQNKNG